MINTTSCPTLLAALVVSGCAISHAETDLRPAADGVLAEAPPIGGSVDPPPDEPILPTPEPPAARPALLGEWVQTPLGCAPGEQLRRMRLDDDGALTDRLTMQDWESGEWQEVYARSGTWELAAPGLVRLRWIDGDSESERLLARAILEAEPFAGEPAEWWSERAFVLAGGAYRFAHWYGVTTMSFDRPLDRLGRCHVDVRVEVTTTRADGQEVSAAETHRASCEVTEYEPTPGLWVVSIDLDGVTPSASDPAVANALASALPRGNHVLDPAQPHVLVQEGSTPMYDGFTREP